MTTKLFSRGIASGEGFCNRSNELEQVVKNIRSITHTLITSPRRYGKTSLILRAIETTQTPYAHIDLFMKYNADSILDEFYQGISQLMSKMIKPTEKAVRKLSSLLKSNVSIGLTFKEVGFEFKIEPKSAESKKNIKSLLMSIDEFLKKNNKNAIIFVDEMQSIIETDICNEIESALRFVAQKTQHITFIFSGSSRRLMSKMFEERSRPFYKLCQKITIQRISADHYRPFINKIAQRRWGKPAPEETLETLFTFTQLHPYYVNVLCSYLFELENLPTEEDVTTQWARVCHEEQGSVAKDIESLTAKQKSLLSEIAKHPNLKEPTAKDFTRRVNLSTRGVTLGIQNLIKHDLVEKLESGEYRVIDPVLKYWAKS